MIRRLDDPRWYLRAFKWWSVGFGIVAAVIGLAALTDLLGASHFGYPWFVAPFVSPDAGWQVASTAESPRT